MIDDKFNGTEVAAKMLREHQEFLDSGPTLQVVMDTYTTMRYAWEGAHSRMQELAQEPGNDGVYISGNWTPVSEVLDRIIGMYQRYSLAHFGYKL